MAYGENMPQTGVASDGSSETITNSTIMVHGGEDRINLPSEISVKDADFSREGMDLIVQDGGHSATIGNYFASTEAPLLEGADGTLLSSKLINSFMGSDANFANTDTMSDESPIGAVHEIEGMATITRLDGTTETMKLGTPVYQGDVIETSGDGAVNIMFIDETTLAVSEDARMAIDEYVFDPASSGGVTNLSVLKGVFVYTSGLIGREDPDDVQIETPSGSIGIRGTIIAADVDSGEVTVMEGAIVLTDRSGNEMTLASQYETAKFNGANGTIENMGQLAANDVAGKYGAVANVSGSLFSSIQDNAANDQSNQSKGQSGEQSEQSLDQNNDGQVDGSVDQNGDGSADGSVDEPAAAGDEHGDATDAVDSPTQTAGQEAQETNTLSFTETRFGSANSLGTSTTSNSAMPVNASSVETGSIASTHSVSTISAGNVAPSSGGSTLGSKTSSLQPIDLSAKTNVQPPPTTETAPPTSVTPTTPTTPTTPSTPPAFSVTSTETPIAENTMGANVAFLTASNGALGTVTLHGRFSDMFEFIQTDTENGVIRLRSGYDLDFETYNNLPIGYTVTDAGSSSVANGVVNAIVTNVNEAPEILSQTSNYMFHGTQNMNWTYNFREDFFDQDIGDNLNFSFTIRDSGGNFLFDDTAVNAANISASTVNFMPGGNMSISFNGTLGGLTGFMIDVTASDSSGLSATTTYDFNLYNQQFTLSAGDTASLISSSGNIYSTILNPSNVSISGDDNQLFFGNGINTGLIVEGNNNVVYLMSGDDEISIDSAAVGNIVSGGNGNDIFNLMSGNNNILGDSGTDRFVFDMNFDILGQMETQASTINGGGEGMGGFFINFGDMPRNGVAARTFVGSGDSIDIGIGSFGSTLDFGTVSNLISNIEFINMNNGQNNVIQLDYEDVLTMTDNRDTLFIKGQSGDALTFDTSGEEMRMGEQVTHESTGEVYDVYFVGDITLLVDIDVAVTTL